MLRSSLPPSPLAIRGCSGWQRTQTPSQILGGRGTQERSAQPGPPGPRFSRPPARPARGQLATAAPFSSRPESVWRAQYQLPGAPGHPATHGPGRRPELVNRWPRRRARDSRLSLTQKMKLNPKSKYLMHLLPPLTGMVQTGLAWDKRHARLGQKRHGSGLRHAEARGWPTAPLLKSATPYGDRPAAMRMCRGMPTPPPAHLPRPCLVHSPGPGSWTRLPCSAEPALHPALPGRVSETLFPFIVLLPTVLGSFQTSRPGHFCPGVKYRPRLSGSFRALRLRVYFGRPGRVICSKGPFQIPAADLPARLSGLLSLLYLLVNLVNLSGPKEHCGR